MQKLLKNNKGFTLVEVIVVAVIVLILAAVAIPLYNGYIADSRRNTASNIAGSIASALGALVQAGTAAQLTAAESAFDAAGNATAAVPVTVGTGNQIIVPKNFFVTVANSSVHVCWAAKSAAAGDGTTGDCSQPYQYTTAAATPPVGGP